MENFHIKKISEVDTKKLIQFYENSFQYEKSLIHNYNWRFRSHFNNFEPLVMLAKDQICGHAGLISVNFISPLYTIVSLILIYIILIVYLNKLLVN